MADERYHCTCHNLGADDFIKACSGGAHNVKACFKFHGRLPKCNNCIPMVKDILTACKASNHMSEKEDNNATL